MTGLPPASRFPDAFLIQDDGRIELRFGGAGDTGTVEIPLWTLEGQDVEAAQLRLLAELRQLGYRVTLDLPSRNAPEGGERGGRPPVIQRSDLVYAPMRCLSPSIPCGSSTYFVLAPLSKAR